MIQQKENDMLLNVLENPSFSIADFQDIGLDVNNTSLQSKDVYKNSQQVTSNPAVQDNNGNLDTAKLDAIYNTATAVYNTMAQQGYDKTQDVKTQYSKYDIFAPDDQVDWAPQFNINTHEVNPDRTTYSTVRFGEQGERTKTPQEIAQSQKVYNPATGEWEASPEESFFGNFKDVRALAQYDEDVDINGKTKGQTGFDADNIAHHAGELKINPDTGTYYYEDLNGRNISGRQLLHISDVLTNEDSPINAIDFLDSDDIHKSAVGSFVKNAALVGSMFLPYVGPVVTGATIVQQAASFGATLGKILTSSDNAAMNYLQGMSEATNFSRTRSEYASQNMWSLENLFGMIGDTVAQLKQQRMLFEQLPKLVGMDGRVLSAKGQQAMQDELIAKYNKSGVLDKAIQDKFKMPMNELYKTNPAEFMNATEQVRLINNLKAAQSIENYVKDYYNVGGVLSKAYMTMLTVNDTYQEAKNAGASDSLAALTTMGYAAAEYALLSTGLGEWILPELRASRMQNKAIVKALTKDTVQAFEQANAKAVTPELKRSLWAKTINFGKKLFNADYAVGRQGTLGKTIASTAASALGEGTEEVSEDVLQDFVKKTYNFYNEINGSSSRMHTENWKDQYLMDFLGGALGGGIANVSINFKTNREASNMTTEKAAQQLVYMSRNKEQLNDFYKVLDKTDIGNKYLSATKTVTDSNGNVIGYEQGTKDDNQDKAIKDLVRQNLDLIQTTLSVDGADLDDKSLFDANTLKDLRWQYLYNSTSTANLIQSFNTLATRALRIHSDIATLNQKLPDQEYKKDDPQYQDIQKAIQSKQQELTDVQNQIKDLREGKKSALFMAQAILETTPYVLQGFDKAATFQGFAETNSGKKYEDISDDELNSLKTKYQDYINGPKKEYVAQATNQYLYATRLFSNKLQEVSDTYTQLVAEGQKELTQLSDTVNALTELQNLSQEDPDKFLEVSQKVQDRIKNSVALSKEDLDRLDALAKANDNYNAEETSSNPSEQALNLGEEPLFGEEQPSTSPNTSKTATISDVDSALTSKITDTDTIDNSTYAEAVQRILSDAYSRNLEETVNRLTSIGSIPADLKQNLVKVISKTKDFIVGRLSNLSQDMAQTGNWNLSNEVSSKNKEFVDNLDKLQRIVDNLSYTPVMDILDSYNSAINGSPIKISEVFEKLKALESQSSSDVSQFLLDDDLSKQLNQASVILDQVQSIVSGARTDDAALTMVDENTLQPKDNIWGINKTLNDIAKASKDDSWKDLPAISGSVADAIYTDIHSIKGRLDYYKTLYGINRGQKLNSQSRISVNSSYLNYKGVKQLSDIVPDDWDKSDLDTILPTLVTLEANYNSGNLNLDKDTQIKLKKESIQLEDAIYEFFQKNKDKDFSELFNEKSYKLLTEKYTLLNESTTDIDSNSFMGWLAAKASIKTSSFLKGLYGINDTKIVPLDPQIQAIQLSVANIINGNTISKFVQAAKDATRKYIDNLSVSERYEYFKQLYPNNTTVAAILSTERGKQLFYTFSSFAPQYSNITLVEGQAGAGKSSAVLKLTSEFIQKYYPDALKNAWTANTSEDTATKLRDNLGIKDGKVFSRESLLKTVLTDYTTPDINADGTINTSKDTKPRIIFDDSGLHHNYTLNDNTTEVPKIIFIDEIGRYTWDEVDALNDWAAKNNVSIITAGDLHQSQTVYNIALKNIKGWSNYKNDIQNEIASNNLIHPQSKTLVDSIKTNTSAILSIQSNAFLHTPKLGSSLRTANSQQDANQQVVDSVLDNIDSYNKELTLHYWESDTELRGTKVVVDDVKSVEESLNKMIAKLGKDEKIGYVYNDTKSKLYQLINSTPKYKDHVEFYKGNSAQGLEGKYWLIEPNVKSSEYSLMQDIYTSITRAQEGSVLVFAHTYGGPNVKLIQSVQDKESQVLSFSDSDKARYTRRYLDISNAALQSFTDTALPKYQERTNNSSTNTKSTSTKAGGVGNGNGTGTSGQGTTGNGGTQGGTQGGSTSAQNPAPAPTPKPSTPKEYVTSMANYNDKYGVDWNVLLDGLAEYTAEKAANGHIIISFPSPMQVQWGVMIGTLNGLDIDPVSKETTAIGLRHPKDGKPYIPQDSNFDAFLAQQVQNLGIQPTTQPTPEPTPEPTPTPEPQSQPQPAPQPSSKPKKKRPVTSKVGWSELDPNAYTVDTSSEDTKITFNNSVKISKAWSNQYINGGNYSKLYSISITPSNLVKATFTKGSKYTTKYTDATLGDISSLEPELQSFINNILNSKQYPTEQGLSDDDAQKQELHKAESEDNNIQEIINQVENQPVSGNNSTVRDFFFMDSSKTFEVGWVKDNSGIYKPSSSNEKTYNRIDGFNGLFNADGTWKSVYKFTDKGNETLQKRQEKAIKLIGQLRQFAFNINNKQQLVKVIAKALKLEESNPYVTFAIKSGDVVSVDGDSNGHHIAQKSNFNKFDKDSEEKTLYSNNSEKIYNRNLVMIIGNGGQDVLEIPLLKLNSPQTKIQSLGDNFKELYINTLNACNGDERQALIKIAANPLIRDHQDIVDWIKIYTNTNNVRTIYYQNDPDWTLGKFSNLGPQYNADRGLGFYDANQSLQQTRDLTPLESMQRPDIMVSDVLSYISNRGKTDDGVTLVSNPGHLFVLYSSNPSYNTTEKLVNRYVQWKTQKAKGEPYIPDVHIKYISTPRVSIDNYLDSIVNITIKGQKGVPILGNDKTSYLVLKSIFLDKGGNPINDAGIKNLIAKGWGTQAANSVYNFLLTKIQELNKLPLPQLMKRLNQVEDWSKSNELPGGFGYSGKSLSTQFMSVIRQLIAPVTIKEDSQGNFTTKPEVNTDCRELFVNLFNKSKQQLYFQSRLQNSQTANVGNTLFKRVQTDPNNRFRIKYDGGIQNLKTQFNIYGDLGSNAFITDDSFGDWLHTIAGRIERSKRIIESDFGIYMDGHSNIANSKSTATPSWNSYSQSILNVLDSSFKKGIVPDSPNSSLTDAQIWSIKEELRKGNKDLLIFTSGNKATPIVFDTGGLNLQFIQNGEPTYRLPITSNDSNFDAIDGITKKHYTVYFNSSTGEIRIVDPSSIQKKLAPQTTQQKPSQKKSTKEQKPQQQPTQEFNKEFLLNDNTLSAYKLLLENVLGNVGGKVRSFKEFVSSASNNSDISEWNTWLQDKGGTRALQKSIIKTLTDAKDTNPGLITEEDKTTKYNLDNVSLEGDYKEKDKSLAKQILSSILEYENKNISCSIGTVKH